MNTITVRITVPEWFGTDDVQNLIESLPMKGEVVDWIPVSERLPEPLSDYPERSGRVLILMGGTHAIGQMEFWPDGARRKWIVEERSGEVSHLIEGTHWMPLPSPPSTN